MVSSLVKRNRELEEENQELRAVREELEAAREELEAKLRDADLRRDYLEFQIDKLRRMLFGLTFRTSRVQFPLFVSWVALMN